MAAREVLASEMAEEKRDFSFQPGVWCERCNKRLVELKRQTLKLILPELNNVIQYEGSLHRVCNIIFYFSFTIIICRCTLFTKGGNVLQLKINKMRKECLQLSLFGSIHLFVIYCLGSWV